MGSYYARADVDIWREEVTAYEMILLSAQESAATLAAAWKETEDAWQARYDIWASDPDAPVEAPEPHPPMPEPTPPPEPPVPSLAVWESRLVEAPEEIQTETGAALIMPGRVVLTADGVSFALAQAELDVAYVPIAEVTL